MAKKALVVFAEGFEDVEAVTVVDILRRAGVEVTAAGVKPGPTRGARGTVVHPDALLDDVKDGAFDALVLPGGTKGAENLAASPTVSGLIARFWKEGKVVAAICAAPGTVLAPAGILEGKNVTGFPGSEAKFPKSAKARVDPVVVDGNLITSRALGTALAFSLVLAETLAGRAVADAVRQAVLAPAI